MPTVELRTLSPDEQALVNQIRELLKDAKPGAPVQLPPELARAIDDAVLAASAPALTEIRKRERRLSWLHSSEACNVDGWEWGIFRVKWLNNGAGNVAEVQQTLGDFSDLDAAIARSSADISPPPILCDGRDGVTDSAASSEAREAISSSSGTDGKSDAGYLQHQRDRIAAAQEHDAREARAVPHQPTGENT